MGHARRNLASAVSKEILMGTLLESRRHWRVGNRGLGKWLAGGPRCWLSDLSFQRTVVSTNEQCPGENTRASQGFRRVQPPSLLGAREQLAASRADTCWSRILARPARQRYPQTLVDRDLVWGVVAISK